MRNSTPSNLSSLRLPPPAIFLEQIRTEKARRHREREQRELAQNAELIRQRCKTFAGFVREAWHVLEPNTPLVWGWHIQSMCDHLEAITFGRLAPRLIINVPPGSSKSMVVSVLWQAWEWGPCGLRSNRFLTTSFEMENVKRDTRKTRDLVMSEWFQALWPEVVIKRAGETSFSNNDTGSREGAPFGSITGKRGDRFCVDDPHSLKGAESEADRNKRVREFLEGGLNRLNDQMRSAIVVVMQRLHEGDLTGALLARKLGFVLLMIPMEFEPERRCETPLPWHDPRSYDGELMDPARMPRAAVDLLKNVSAFSWAGQYQQRPTAREGGMFKRIWFADKILDAAPVGTRWVRHWDLAATKKGDGARTAGVKIGRTPDGKFVVGHSIALREDGAGVRAIIKATAEVDGRPVSISLPQDPGQAGKVQAADMIAMLAGYRVSAEPETGDKVTRAEPFAAQCAVGNVSLVRGEWNEGYIDELCLFPGAVLKDQVDASSGAFGKLAGIKGPMVIPDAVLQRSMQRT
jgi:predicted phage terminase large subunit-like protein